MSTPADSAVKPVIVGLDGASNSSSAVSWAAEEAVRAGRPLKLLTVTEKVVVRTPTYVLDPVEFDYVDHAQGFLSQAAEQVRQQHTGLDVRTEVRVDEPVKGLLTEAADAALIVVGKRGIGAFERVMLGSTSIALAGRSPVPTVIVPDVWNAAEHEGESILVGLDVHHDSDAMLGFAFERASELDVPLVVMHVWDTHPVLVPTEGDLDRWADEARAAVESALAPWREKFPNVQAVAAQRYAHHAQGLLDAGDRAQLLILGRRSSGRTAIGFRLRSTSRAVLHYSERPVAVIPTAAGS
jgi:nucleotide-binding universal stress UspA family protein